MPHSRVFSISLAVKQEFLTMISSFERTIATLSKKNK